VTAATRLSYLRVALILVGLIFIFGVYPLMMALWPSGWRWSPNQAQYEQMILGVYATLGVFLLIASRNPLRHLSLIWFTVFSSIVHAGIMTVQALRMPSEHGHLFGDVPALFIVAALLAFLTPSSADGAQVSS
jgi:ABC-type transport system involved in cytochrome c biogenesis permease subunit